MIPKAGIHNRQQMSRVLRVTKTAVKVLGMDLWISVNNAC